MTNGSPPNDNFSAVEKKDGGLLVTLTQVADNGQTLPHEKMLVTEKGLTRTEISGSPLTPPLVMLRVPHPKGDRWEFATSGAWGNGVEVKKILPLASRASPEHTSWPGLGPISRCRKWPGQAGAMTVWKPSGSSSL